MRRAHPTLILVVAAALSFGFGPAASDDASPLLTVSAHASMRQEGGGAAPTDEAEAAHAGATFVGADTCTACHDTVETGLASTAHGSATFGRMAVHGCETCHGPGSAHIDDPENPDLQPRVDRMSAKQQSEMCQTCHDGREQFHWQGSMHAKRGVACTTCHSVHSPKAEPQLKMATEMEQCATCHQQVRAETWKNSHHPIREGEISCSSCHNPHGSQTERMVRADSINDLCYSCHTEKRGPFLWEHAPVRESCMTCHTPHGSNHAKLQRIANPYLCQQCHANTRHPGTLYDARNIPVAPDGLPVPSSPSNRLVERGCVNCHSAVHGSNHPSSPYLAH